MDGCIAVHEGQTVEQGQQVAVVEAMKMQVITCYHFSISIYIHIYTLLLVL
jgi:acetyl/propionyl-CoA carboxylase alpha subunit